MTRRPALPLALVLAVGLATTTATVAPTIVHAQPSATAPTLLPPAPPPPTVTRTYGGSIAACDLAALALIVIGSKAEPAAALGLAAYVAGGPLVHLHHDNPGRAAGSLAMRLGIPLTGAMIGGAAFANSHDDDDEYDEGTDFGVLIGAAFGLVIGGIVASVLDASLLAREQVEAGPQLQIHADGERTTVSLGGSF